MKKVFAVLTLVMACFTCAFFSACTPEGEPQEVILGFDRPSAYFAGEKALVPISDTAPVAGDIFEEAKIVMHANEPVKMRLTAVFENNAGIDKLMAVLNNSAAVSFESGIVLYESTEPETQAELNIKIFLAANADAHLSADKQLSFTLELTYYQE